MVPEQRTCCYKVCHMVPEQRTRTVCYTVCKPVCYQKTIQVYEVRAAVRALHGDPLRAAVRLQAGAGDGLLPAARATAVAKWLRRWLRRRLQRWLRLQQLACERGLLPA